jgi:WD40 repeat protein
MVRKVYFDFSFEAAFFGATAVLHLEWSTASLGKCPQLWAQTVLGHKQIYSPAWYNDMHGDIGGRRARRCWVTSASDKRFLNVVMVRDVETGACPFTLQGHTDRVYSVAMSADGARVVIGYGDMSKAWDAETGACLCTLQQGQTTSVGGKRVSTAFRIGVLDVWDAVRFPRHALAFAMALQPRLGAGCLSRELEPAIVQLIRKQFFVPCWDGE